MSGNVEPTDDISNEESPLLAAFLRESGSPPLAEPWASLPIEKLRAYVAAMETRDHPRTTLAERRDFALAVAPVIEHCARACSADSPRALQAIEAIEVAWRHFSGVGDEGVCRRADHVIQQLNWARKLVDAGRNVAEVAALLREIEEGYFSDEAARGIPLERWEEAIRAWRGEIPAPRGRPAKGAETYHWHRLLHRLLTGTTDPEPEATQFRDSLLKWRRARLKK